MKGLVRIVGIIFFATMGVCFSGCRLIGDYGNDSTGTIIAGTNQLAVRTTGIPVPSVRAGVLAWLAPVNPPATATVTLYQGTALVSGPHVMGTDGYVFRDLTDGTYTVRIMIGPLIFQITKTLNTTVPALVVVVSYAKDSGESGMILFETKLDTDKDGLPDPEETVVSKEPIEGSADWDKTPDPPDVGLNAWLKTPIGFTSVAFPATSPNVTIPSVSADNTIGLVLVNTHQPTDQKATVAVAFSAASPNALVRASIAAGKTVSAPPPQLTKAQRFHLQLRQRATQLPRPTFGQSLSVRPNIVADTENQTRTFTLSEYDTTTGEAYTFTGVCKRVIANLGTPTRKTYIYLDQADVNEASANKILDQLAAAWPSIYHNDVRIFGEDPDDLTMNDHALSSTDITILLSSKIMAYGYFWSGDLFPTSKWPGSNQRKMFYLNYDPATSMADYKATLAHEFQHMIYYFQRAKADVNSDPNEDCWLDEAMATYAELANDITLSNGNMTAAGQILSYLENATSTSLIGWEGGDPDYGKGYLFGSWIANNFGTGGVVRTLIAKAGTSQAIVAAFTGKTFPEVFKQFALALWANKTLGGFYGLKDINLVKTYFFMEAEDEVRLRGPATIGGAIPVTNATTMIVPYGVGFAEITGGNGGAINLTLPVDDPALSCYQLMK